MSDHEVGTDEGVGEKESVREREPSEREQGERCILF